jgi:hypothetical protein
MISSRGQCAWTALQQPPITTLKGTPCSSTGIARIAALTTRAFVQAGGDYYLMPLPQTGEVPELLMVLLEPVWSERQSLQRIYARREEEAAEEAESRAELLALGYEVR